jgi:hypothetical protein
MSATVAVDSLAAVETGGDVVDYLLDDEGLGYGRHVANAGGVRRRRCADGWDEVRLVDEDGAVLVRYLERPPTDDATSVGDARVSGPVAGLRARLERGADPDEELFAVVARREREGEPLSGPLAGELTFFAANEADARRVPAPGEERRAHGRAGGGGAAAPDGRSGDGSDSIALTYFTVDAPGIEAVYRDRLGALAADSGATRDDLAADVREVFSARAFADEFYADLRATIRDRLRGAIADREHPDASPEAYAQTLLSRLLFLLLVERTGRFGDPAYVERRYEAARSRSDLDVRADLFEPLFFEALSDPDAEVDEFLGTLPFLNGALFERRDGEGELGVDPAFFDALLAPGPDDGEPEGVLRRYRYAPTEPTPRERELVVDAEVFGGALELFVDEGDRSERGTFYTPEPVATYVAQTALARYLAGAVDGLSTPESFALVADRTVPTTADAATVDAARDALEEIRVLDPAVGSGAFVIAVLDELVGASRALDRTCGRERGPVERVRAFLPRIYGVDVDADGIERCRLRVWLYLLGAAPGSGCAGDVAARDGRPSGRRADGEDAADGTDDDNVDEAISTAAGDATADSAPDKATETGHAPTDAVPLPNLDCQFFVGNSLVGECDPVWSGGEEAALPEGVPGILAAIERTREAYLSARGERRGDLSARLDALGDRLSARLEAAGVDGGWMTDVAAEAGRSFAWRRAVPEAVLDGGFDVVVGNPPYEGRSRQGYVAALSRHYDRRYDFYETIPRMRHDLYQKFAIRGWELAREGGVVAFVTSATFLTIGSKRATRRLLQRNRLCDLVCANPEAFDATVDPAIFAFRKEPPPDDHALTFVDASGTDVGTYRSLAGRLGRSEAAAEVGVDAAGAGEERAENEPVDREGRESVPGDRDGRESDAKKEVAGSEGNTRETQPSYERATAASLDLPAPTRGYRVPLRVYRNTPRNAFFEPTRTNLRLHGRLLSRAYALAEEWADAIRDSDALAANRDRIERDHLSTLSPGDVSLLGLLTRGGQGLATADNDEYLAYLDGTPPAERVKSRNERFRYVARNENRFGWMSRVVRPEDVVRAEELTDEEKREGIAGRDATWVPILKGKGDPYYDPVTEYVRWSREAVAALRTDPNARWQGAEYFFEEGLFVSRGGTGNPVVRHAPPAVVDSSGGIFVPSSGCVSARYLNGVLNSAVVQHVVDQFVNGTVNTQIQDLRHVPIVIPTGRQRERVEALVEEAIAIRLAESDVPDPAVDAGSLPPADRPLDAVSAAIDELVAEIYGVRIDG